MSERDIIGGMLAFAADHEQTAAAAEAELRADGVDVDGFLARTSEEHEATMAEIRAVLDQIKLRGDSGPTTMTIDEHGNGYACSAFKIASGTFTVDLTRYWPRWRRLRHRRLARAAERRAVERGHRRAAQLRLVRVFVLAFASAPPSRPAFSAGAFSVEGDCAGGIHLGAWRARS